MLAGCWRISGNGCAFFDAFFLNEDMLDLLGPQHLLDTHERGAQHRAALRFGLELFFGHLRVPVRRAENVNQRRNQCESDNTNDDERHTNLILEYAAKPSERDGSGLFHCRLLRTLE